MNFINYTLPYIWLIVGFILLVKGADFFVEGSSSAANLLKIPTVIIGLTIVALGTSAPELAVSVSASFSGYNEIAVGNVIGSNFFNLLVVVGVCAIIKPITVTRTLQKRDMPFSALATLIVLGFVYVGSGFTIDGDHDYGIARFSGIALVILFIVYLVILIHFALKNRQQGNSYKIRKPLVCAILILVGLAGIVIGGRLVVDNAKIIAATLGMSESLIGLTVVALGTSLPELVTSVVAAKKGDSDMALGNVIGSNTLNLLLVLGLSAVVHPIELNSAGIESIIDLILLIMVNVIVIVMAFKSNIFAKKAGFTMVLIYVAYTAYIIMRNYKILPVLFIY